MAIWLFKEEDKVKKGRKGKKKSETHVSFYTESLSFCVLFFKARPTRLSPLMIYTSTPLSLALIVVDVKKTYSTEPKLIV